MKETVLQLQIYYEMAMAIGNSLDLNVMLKQSLSTFLRKLNCFAAIVFQIKEATSLESGFESIFTLPRRLNRNSVVRSALDQIPAAMPPSQLDQFWKELPMTGDCGDNKFFHLMALPGFGLLLLLKSNRPLDPPVIKSLQPLNIKLAGACCACQQSGKIENLVVRLSTEVAERQKTETQLRISKQKYQTIFENIQDIYYETALDGRILEISPSAELLFGVRREQLIGIFVENFYVYPQELVALMEMFQREGHVYDHEVQFKTGDGRIVDCAINAVLQRGESGEPPKIVGSLRDVSKRKQAEREIGRAKEKAESAAQKLQQANKELHKLHRAVEQSPTAVVITDLDGCIEYVNPSFTRLSGYSPEEILGRNPNVLKSGRQKDEFYRQLWQTISAGRVWEGELLNKGRNGQLYWEHDYIAPVKNENGRITHYIAVKEDISWRKQAEARLARAQKELSNANAARSQFLANVSHEIRTPINGLIGMTALLLETGLDARQREMATTIRLSADNLLAAMNNILDYAKLMAGQFNLQEGPFHLEALLNDIVTMTAPYLEDKPLDFICETAPQIPCDLRGDPSHIKQVLINLVSNAVKYTPKGKVTLSVILAGESDTRVTLRFAVKDTGIGIPQSYQSRLFESFSQQDASMSRRFGGTGLGLAISKALVELMGGALDVESREGSGSTFWFTLELDKSPQCRRSSGRLGKPLKAHFDTAGEKTKGNILLAEDNPINQKITLKILEKLGYHAEAVSNGREALEALAGRDYHLILMDIQMPEMDGLTATRTIRGADGTFKNPQIPIVALTAHAMKGDREACLDAGMNDYLSKPVDPGQLSEAIHKHLSQG